MSTGDHNMTSRRNAPLICLGAIALALCLLASLGHGPAERIGLAAAGATPVAESSPMSPPETPTPSPVNAPASSPTSTATATATATPVDPIVVTALDPKLALIPSAATTARFRIANTGAVPIAVAITAACSRTEWCAGAILRDDGTPIANPVQLGAGQSIVVRLPIAIPADARLDEHATLRILADIVG